MTEPTIFVLCEAPPLAITARALDMVRSFVDACAAAENIAFRARLSWVVGERKFAPEEGREIERMVGTLEAAAFAEWFAAYSGTHGRELPPHVGLGGDHADKPWHNKVTVDGTDVDLVIETFPDALFDTKRTIDFVAKPDSDGGRFVLL